MSEGVGTSGRRNKYLKRVFSLNLGMIGTTLCKNTTVHRGFFFTLLDAKNYFVIKVNSAILNSTSLY